MAKRIATLSGWGQPYDALSAIAPDATHVDYARHTNVGDALADIADQARDHDMVIGWSLGGQLAVRAIAAGLLKPEFLVLFATPYQFVATAQNPLGMKRDLYDKFRANMARDPDRAMHKAWELIVKGDTHADLVRGAMEKQDKKSMLKKDWLQWLDRLDGFSFADTNFVDFPPALLIHGDRDAVVAPEQSQRLAGAMPHARLVLFNGCGHAPHWHDAERVRELIKEHGNV